MRSLRLSRTSHGSRLATGVAVAFASFAIHPLLSGASAATTGEGAGVAAVPGPSARTDDDAAIDVRQAGGGVAGGGPITCPTGVGCQIPDLLGHGGFLGLLSDFNGGVFPYRVADNFRTDAAGTITSLCWWGLYTDGVTPSCDPGPGDSFAVTYYNDDAGGSIPGSILAGPLSVTVTSKFATGRILIGVPPNQWPEYQFEGTHAPVLVGSGCVWIEILNNTAADTTCWWVWSTAPPGDFVAAQDDGITGWDPSDALELDMAFCVDVSIATYGCSPCGPGAGDCCTAHGGPGCDGGGCCLLICITDPSCCDVEWDASCAALAQTQCAPCTVGSLQTLYDTGSSFSAFNVTTGSFGLIGWASGNLDNNLDPQRRTVQAFTLPPGPAAWRIPVIWCSGFIGGGATNETFHVEVFGRTPGHPSFPDWPGPAPTPLDLVATATAPHPQAGIDDPRPESPLVDSRLFVFDLEAGSGALELPPGDYWLTVYPSNDNVPFVPSSFGWHTHADVDDQYHNFCTDQSPPDYPGGGSLGCGASPDGTPMMYRARKYPPVDPATDDTGYRSYYVPSIIDLDPDSPNQDPADLYNTSFALFGEPCSCPPANDDCVDRVEIFDGQSPFDTIGATTDGPVLCGPGGPDVWFNYNAQFTGTLVVSTCGGLSFDTALAVYDGCGCPAGPGNLLVCNDDFCGLQSQVAVHVVAGNCYKIQVFGLKGILSVYGFEDPQETPAAGEVSSQAIGDLDGDGFLDVIAVIPGTNLRMPGAVQLFFNQGVGTNGAWLGLAQGPVIGVELEPRGVAVGPFNGDQHLDFAVTNAGSNAVSVFLNNGGGTFVPGTTVENVGNRPLAIVARDLGEDMNNDIDLAVTLEDDGAVVLLFGDGTGGFGGGLATVFPLFAAGPSPFAMSSGDFDNNKDDDLTGTNNTGSALATGAGGTVFVLLHAGGGNFFPAQFYAVGNNPTDLAVADFDGDQFLDIVASNSSDATVSVLLNNQDGTFAPQAVVPVGDSPKSVEAIDLTGDAQPDLAVVAIDPVIGPAVQVMANLFGDQGLSFDEPNAFGVEATPNFVVTADLNGDGASDLVTGNADDGKTGGSVTALLNTPAPSECPWDCDATDDGIVSVTDLLALLGQYDPGSPQTCDGGSCDFNADGCVDVVDLLKLLAHYDPAAVGCP